MRLGAGGVSSVAGVHGAGINCRVLCRVLHWGWVLCINDMALTGSDVKVQFSPVLPHIFPNPELDFRVRFRPPLELQT